MSEQLEKWTGEFGVEYTDRNRPDWQDLVPTWKQILRELPEPPLSILEVGANVGHNMQALQSLYSKAKVSGVEPQEYARDVARGIGLTVHEGSIPGKLPRADLVLTAGVLIHTAPENLEAAMRSVHTAARRWVLAVEYFNETDAMVDYRGMDNQLWIRDYGAHYQRLFPKLKLLDSGELAEGGGFDRCNYWLFQK